MDDEQRDSFRARDREGMLNAQRHLAESGRYAVNDVVGFLGTKLNHREKWSRSDRRSHESIAIIPAVVTAVSDDGRINVEVSVPTSTYVFPNQLLVTATFADLEVDREGYGNLIAPLHDLKQEDLDVILGKRYMSMLGKLSPDDPEVLEAVDIELRRLRPEGSGRDV